MIDTFSAGGPFSEQPLAGVPTWDGPQEWLVDAVAKIRDSRPPAGGDEFFFLARRNCRLPAYRSPAAALPETPRLVITLCNRAPTPPPSKALKPLGAATKRKVKGPGKRQKL